MCSSTTPSTASTSTPTSVEQVTVENTVLTPGWIALTVRNTGPDPVTIAQVFVNDAYVDVRGGVEPIGRMPRARTTTAPAPPPRPPSPTS
jgi:hypothetical protein